MQHHPSEPTPIQPQPPTVCSWCEPVNDASNHTICDMHMRQFEAAIRQAHQQRTERARQQAAEYVLESNR